MSFLLDLFAHSVAAAYKKLRLIAEGKGEENYYKGPRVQKKKWG